MRPSKIHDKKLRERCLEALAAGASRKDSANYAGFSEQSFHNWRAIAEKYELAKEEERNEDHKVHFEFFEEIKKVEAETKFSAVSYIKKAWLGDIVVERKTITREDGSTEVFEKFAQPQWTAAAWFLERKDNKNWGRRETIKHQGDPEEPVVVKVVSSELASTPWLDKPDDGS